MSYYWTPKLNTATNRRLAKLESENVKIDTFSHAGRKVIGYNYLESIEVEDDESSKS